MPTSPPPAAFSRGPVGEGRKIRSARQSSLPLGQKGVRLAHLPKRPLALGAASYAHLLH